MRTLHYLNQWLVIVYATVRSISSSNFIKIVNCLSLIKIHTIYTYLEWIGSRDQWVNSLKPRQNGSHFPDDVSKWIFLNENVWILIKISLKFVSKGLINNIPALVQIMAWCRPGNKQLSEPMMVRLQTHICITRPQWVNIIMSYSMSCRHMAVLVICLKW